MIHCFFGEDTQKARQAARELFEQLRNDNKSATASYFDDVLFDISAATDAFTSENLFGGQNILYFDGILEHADGETFYRTILQKTEHDVIIREVAPSKDLLAFFERLGVVKLFPLQKRFEKRVDSFPVANALGARDKRASWVEFEKVRRSGAAMEEIHGTIFWAYKTMLITRLLDKKDALRSGVKDTSYRTYNAHAQGYTIDELKDKILLLKDIYHKGHRGEGEIEDMLEQFILSN